MGTVFFTLVNIQIGLNGEPKTVAAGLTVMQLLDELHIHPGRVIIELNREILSRESYGTAILKDGDTLEIVHFVGGG